MTQKPEFTVHDVFYIAPPVDSVIATGIVDSGRFRVGDPITVADGITSTIGKIESIQYGEIQEASAGDNVGFHLTGVDRGQVTSGDRIVGSD
jgi:translation elongation factor EF-Tu-like GTPase